MNIRETAPRITELEKISTRTDTRDYLAKAAPTKEKLKDWLVVDVDAHVNETAFWSEVTDRIDNDVLRYIAEAFRDRGPAPGLFNANGPLYQDVAGRIMHQQKLAEPTPPGLASSGAAQPARHGCDGHRLHGGVPDPDAFARHAPAGRCRSGARQRL